MAKFRIQTADGQDAGIQVAVLGDTIKADKSGFFVLSTKQAEELALTYTVKGESGLEVGDDEEVKDSTPKGAKKKS